MKRKIIIGIIVLQIGVALSVWTLTKSLIAKPAIATAETQLPTMTLSQLKEFDGTDPNKPIYLAMDGKIYDVSAGREYYEPIGSYHMLAGTDASAMLHIAGGSIIQKKYKVIATLIN